MKVADITLELPTPTSTRRPVIWRALRGKADESLRATMRQTTFVLHGESRMLIDS